MRERLAIAGLLLLLGVAIGRNLSKPSPPDITHITEIRERAAKADTIFVRDTIRYHEWKTVYDTVREQLDITDTVAVVRYVRVADSTIAACSLALKSCINTLAMKDTVILLQDKYIAEGHKRSTWQILLAGGALIVGAGLVLSR